MKLFDIITLTDETIKPKDCKLHLACGLGDEPLNVFFAGGFKGWQEEQNKRIFQRPYIVALIDLLEKGRWLFAGVYKVLDCDGPVNGNCGYKYTTKEVSSLKEYVGRVVVGFDKKFRYPYPYVETVVNDLDVVELKSEKMSVAAFPGFNNVLISHNVLQSIVTLQTESWRSILSNVKGVYAIIDTSTGKIYIGSATGEDMIWQRWSNYALTGHGGNKTLKRLVKEKGPDYPMNYQYTILEIADPHATKEDILARESFWKNVLCSREHGYNEN